MTNLLSPIHFSEENFLQWKKTFPKKDNLLNDWQKSNISYQQFMSSFFDLMLQDNSDGKKNSHLYVSFYHYLYSSGFPVIETTLHELENFYYTKYSNHYLFILNLFISLIDNQDIVFSEQQINFLLPDWKNSNYNAKEAGIFVNSTIKLVEHTINPEFYFDKITTALLYGVDCFKEDIPYDFQLPIYNYLKKYGKDNQQLYNKLCPDLTYEQCFTETTLFKKQIFLNVNRIKFQYGIKPCMDEHLSHLLKSTHAIVSSDPFMIKFNKNIMLYDTSFSLASDKSNNDLLISFTGPNEEHMQLLNSAMVSALDYVLSNYQTITNVDPQSKSSNIFGLDATILYNVYFYAYRA